MLNNLDFNKLRTFYWVYNKQSLLEASRNLHVTPSAVSQAVRALEKKYWRVSFCTIWEKVFAYTSRGVPLFIGRKVYVRT